MKSFASLLRSNRNYRYTWIGQVVSEIGDHFNNVAVFSLAVATTRSGLVVSGIMLSRAVSMMLAGPLAGVVLDRLDRKRVMIASDLFRAVMASLFILAAHQQSTWMLYVLSGLLMFASPFFTSGRTSILPTIATREELHAANSLTQTTQWSTLAIGAVLGGTSVGQFGYDAAFLCNALSFVISAVCIAQLYLGRDGFRPPRAALTEAQVVRPWHEYVEGLRYIRSIPLVFALLMVNVGWASGGGAASILFSIFGEIVFNRGPSGLGMIWGCAGLGLVAGGGLAYAIGRRLTFSHYKHSIAICYILHGGCYILFSQEQNFYWALMWIALSRAGVGFSSVMNMSYLLRRVSNEFRGRVFATLESTTWTVMLVSMTLAGVASQTWDPRTIGALAGVVSSTTAIFWAWANLTGKLPEPENEGVEPEEIEVREPAV